MSRRLNAVVEPPARPSTAPPHSTSWYAQGRSDVLGDRLLMFDNATSGSFELLRFRPDLASVGRFEQALRNRVSRLETFRHPAFASVRGVEHLDEGKGLTLVSTHVPGRRLSEMLQAPRLVGLHPTFATWLILQLTPALADLQRQGGDIAHGALSADRIVLTPDGSFVMVEYVLGAALECLYLSPARLWSEFGIASPPTDTEVARLDRRTDVIQLALVVLSILLGRRVASTEYPSGLATLLDECAGATGQRSQWILPLRRWLERAFGLAGQPFKSADEARLGLTELQGYGPPTAIGGQPSPALSAPAAASAPAGFKTRGSVPRQPDHSGLESASKDTSMKNPAVHLVGARTAGSFGQSASRTAEATRPSTPPVSSKKRGRLAPALAICLGLLALGEAAGIGYLLATRWVVMPSVRLPVMIDSPDAGDLVVVDGRQAGTTPLNLSVGADVRSIRVVTRNAQPVPGFAAADVAEKRTDLAAPVDSKTTAALAVAAARQRSGGIRFSSPIELKVLEGERVLGSTADGPIVTTAGVHELELINTAFGYRSRQTFNIKAGQIVSLSIAPPEGRVSINASPWAQVWIDGKPLGETPIANVSAAVGEHDITFRHPQLGEKRETVVVKSDALTRVSASFGR